MTMGRAKEGLAEWGDHDLEEEQAGILAKFQGRHPGVDDIPLEGKLPQNQTARTEITLSPLSPETQALVEQMRGDGYAVYETTGRTPASLRADGMRYWSLHPKLADITVPPALLAFRKNPSQFFLPGSMNIPHDDQVRLIPAEQVRVDGAYPGAGLVVREGKLPEWTELALKHLKLTKVRIFGSDYGYNSTWTDTYESEQRGANRARFGRWSGAGGARAFLWEPGLVDLSLRLAPLVEIPRKLAA